MFGMSMVIYAVLSLGTNNGERKQISSKTKSEIK